MHINNCVVSHLLQAIGHSWQTYVILFRFDSNSPGERNSDILRSDIQSSFSLNCGLSAQAQQSSLNLFHICPCLIGKSLWAYCETFPFLLYLSLPLPDFIFPKKSMFWKWIFLFVWCFKKKKTLLDSID